MEALRCIILHWLAASPVVPVAPMSNFSSHIYIYLVHSGPYRYPIYSTIIYFQYLEKKGGDNSSR